MVVDRFSKCAHFILLSQPYTAAIGARLFFNSIFKLYSLPESIVCGLDVVFTSLFWNKLHLCGAKLAFSYSYHPQSDG